MKKTEVQVLNYNACIEAYSDWPLCKSRNICPVPTDICTGGDETGSNSCAGDTGGPLVDMEKKVILTKCNLLMLLAHRLTG